MTVGRNQRANPSYEGGLSIVFPGRSMHSASQVSPNTFAKDVPISAKTTSEKRMGVFMEENRHLRIALGEP